MKPRITALTPHDVSTMRRMLDLFGREFEDTATYCARQPDDAYVAKLLGSDTFIAIAAMDGDEIVGGLAGYVLPTGARRRSRHLRYFRAGRLRRRPRCRALHEAGDSRRRHAL